MTRSPTKVISREQIKILREKVNKATDVDVFTSPDSSNLEGGSRYSTGITVLGFRDKKKPDAQVIFYYYPDVSWEDWAALKDAPSKGKYMQEVFAKKYRGFRI